MQRLYDEQAWVYDAAFGEADEGEIDWLLERLGHPKRVLEPACGSGRLLGALARRGIEVAGLDGSAPMLARARERFRAAGLPEPSLVRADMADFRLAQRFDAAVCPINSLGYLQRIEQAAGHLRCVAGHLASGGRYLVQLDLRRLDDRGPGNPVRWESRTPLGTLRCTWTGGPLDPETGLETQVSRFEFTDGPRAGEAYEDTHPMRRWNWAAWRKLVEGSPFGQVAAWAGDDKTRPPLAIGPGLEGHWLTWHELVLKTGFGVSFAP